MVYTSFWTVRPLFALVIHFSTTFGSTCYHPDGTTIAPDTPCTNSAMSACCGPQAYCLDNGLCFLNNLLTRGSCTDQTWKASECASYCQTVMEPFASTRYIPNLVFTQVNPSGGKGMAPCSSNLWACDYGSCPEGNFTVANGNLVLRDYQAASLGVSAAASTVTVISTLAGSALVLSATPFPTSPSQSSDSGSTATSVSGDPTVFVVSTMVGSTLILLLTATAPNSAQTSASQTIPLGMAASPLTTAGGQNDSATCISSSTSQANNSTIIAVAAGIGAPLGIALAALFLMFCRERKRNTRLQQNRPPMTGTRSSSRNTLEGLKNGGLGQYGRRVTVAELNGDMQGSLLHELNGGNTI